MFVHLKLASPLAAEPVAFSSIEPAPFTWIVATLPVAPLVFELIPTAFEDVPLIVIATPLVAVEVIKVGTATVVPHEMSTPCGKFVAMDPVDLPSIRIVPVAELINDPLLIKMPLPLVELPLITMLPPPETIFGKVLFPPPDPPMIVPATVGPPPLVVV